MKKFCLVALLVLATINVSYSKNLDSVLAQINDHPYGQALGSLVQMHMSTGDDQGTLQEIHDMLESLQGDIQSQEQVADAKCNEIKNDCDVNTPATQAELNQLNETNQDNQNELTQLQEEIRAKEQDLRDKQQEQQDIDTDLSQLEGTVEEGEQNFLARQADFSNAISACKAAMTLIDEMVDGAHGLGSSFLEVSSSFLSIKDLFQKEVRLDKSTAAFIQPISDVLLELSTENTLNVEKVHEVKSLIQLLVDTLDLGLSDHNNEYARRIDMLQKQEDDLNAQRHTLTLEIDILVERLQEAHDRQAQLSTLIAANNSLVQAKERELQNLATECGTQDQMCSAASVKRENELRIIGQLLEFFKAHVSA